MKGVDQFPCLNLNIIKRIVVDGVALSDNIEKVGLIGSFATNTQTPISDVDLLVKVKDPTQYGKVLETFGFFVEDVLDYQFNKRLDIVHYETAALRAVVPPSASQWYYKAGYEKMLKEVVWIYEG